MSSRRNSGRHRSATVPASAFATISKAVAQAAEAPVQRESASAGNLEVSSQAPAQIQLSADSSVAIAFERPAVSTTPAPVIEAPEPAAQLQSSSATATATAAQAVVAAPAKPAVSVRTTAAAAPAAGGVNSAMVAAAYAQLGMTQDCTALVEKALGAAGIPVGDLAPMQFMGYGKVVGTAQPGDMVVQSGHVGIYVGNGQVLSSGMNGTNQTVVHPLSWLSANGSVTFVRAGA